MVDITIEHYSKMIQSEDAIRLSALGYVELLQKRYISNTIPLHYTYSAIIAYGQEPRTPLGILIWFDAESEDQLWIQMAYVAPEHRLKGIHKALFDALKDKAKEIKRNYIGSGIHVNNQIMIEAAKAEGREIIGLITRYKVV